ncbi:MAG: RHS domain-containing protein, partial [Myxococcota bacterium]|nr:RHS domain-containing protein [Myxococcota bacterium]
GSTAAGPDASRTATTWEAEYDALGRRTKKVVHRADANGAPVRDEWRFVWDRDRLAAEVLPDGRLRLYVYPDAVALVPMLAVEYASTTSDPRRGRVYSFHTDHRGAVERVEDAAGNVVWEAELGPYGEANVLLGADFHQPFRLVGQYYDAETGLCAHRYRMYSPELGRFLESDPIGLQGGLNVYAWPGCPLVVTDPLGLGCPHAESGSSATPPAEAEGTPTPGPTRPPRRLEEMSDAELRDHCETRARELQAAYDAAHPRQARAVTLSVGVVQDSRGRRRVVVTTSADGQRVPRAVRRALGPGESVRATSPRLRRRRERNPNFDESRPAHPIDNPRTRSRTVEVVDNPTPPPATTTQPYTRAERGVPVSGTRHHAEQRMEAGAAANGETLLAQAPTRRCCSGCQTALGPEGLSRVPESLRGTE